MPISLTWDNSELTVIRLTFDGQWSWDDCDDAVSLITDMLADVNHPIDLIIHFRSCHVSHDTIKQVKSGNAFYWPPQAGLGALVGVKGFLRTLLMLVIHVYPDSAQRFLIAPTVEDARRMLLKHRQQTTIVH
jgi:hypothetical protein